jgi:agmatine/peptidylarginine deiminase
MKKALSIFTLLLLMAATMQAQDNKKPDWARWHYLSEAEMYDTSRGMNFVETNPPAGEPRFVAEFEPMQGVMIRYPLGIPTSLVVQLANNCHVYCVVSSGYQNQAQNSFQSAGVDMSNVTFVNAPTDSYWIRDYGPWYIFEDRNPAIVDNVYNRPRPNDDEISGVFANFWNIPMYGMNLEHTGGNMMEDGRGHGVSDNLVLQENNNNETNVRNKMRDYLGIDPYHITIDPQGDYIAHVDCWGKYLAPDKILIARVPQSNSHYNDYESVAQYFETTNCCWGYPYHVYRVDEPGGYTLAPYTNSLILNKTVYVPLGTNSTYNNNALAVYQEAMPGYEIVGVNGGSAGWENTDALHCRTRGVMDFNMLFVDHRNVLFGEQDWQDSIAVTSKFIAYSGANLKQDSLLVYYSIDGGAYQVAHMTATGNPDEYVGYIKGYQGESEINYYVFGADESGHRYTQPVFADLDPHHFTMEEHQPAGELEVTPETLTFESFPETHTFQIINGTNAPVSVTGINVSPYDNALLLSHASLPQTLQPNQTMTVTVELNAMGYKGYNNYIINVATSVGNRQVTVRVNEEAWDEGLMLWPMQGLTFDENSPMTQTFWLKNTNALQSITVNEVHEDGSNYFEMTPAHSLPYQIPAGGMFEVTVTLVNFPENNTEANVYVRSTDGEINATFFHIAGGLSGGGGEFTVTPRTLYFENNEVQSISLVNETNEAVVVSAMNQPDNTAVYANIWYEGQPISNVLPLTIQPGQTIQVGVNFVEPPYPGKSDYYSYIEIVSSAGNRRVDLVISDSIWGGLLSFEDIWLENFEPVSETVFNYYLSSVVINEIYEQWTDYLIIESEPLPILVPSLSSFTFTVKAREGRKGYQDTRIVLSTDHGNVFITVHINENLLSVTELSAEAKLYPNPTTGQFTMEGANVAKVEVYNLVGQKVCEQQGSKAVNIDATNWNKGLYFVNIIEENGAVVTKKLVVK